MTETRRNGGVPRVAVVLLTLDQREKTFRCLRSLHRMAEPRPDIVLWDNGSCDGTAEAVAREFPAVVIHHNPTNAGVASGRNAAATIALDTFAPTHLFFLDNDMEVSPDFLAPLLAPFAADARVGHTTGKIRFLGEENRLYGAGGCVLQFWRGRTGHVGYGQVDRGQFDRPHRCLPSGGCMLVRVDLFRRLGGFDTGYNPYGPEDLDFGLRMRDIGYHGVYVPESVVYHESISSRTGSGGGMRSQRYVRDKSRHWFRFMARHASLGERILFYSLGAPLGVARMLVREGRRGNFRALTGLAAGFTEARRTAAPSPEAR